VLFAGGGTGGHVYPGLSVAQALRRLRPDARILYAGTGDREEARIVRTAGLRYTGVRSAGIRARSPWRAARGVALMSVGVGQALRLLLRFRPRAVFATGGYGTVPVAVAAAIRRTPLVVFLPDVYPGWAVRFTAKLATRVATTAEPALEFLPPAKTAVTGYPVREEFFAIDRMEARPRAGLPPGAPVLLVTGGSSGAVTLNSAFVRHLPQFTTMAHVVHLTGRRDEARIVSYRERLSPVQREHYRVLAYADDMPALMAAADLCICRAGASTLGELPAVGLPAVLVPLELSDQARNARFLESQGAAVVVRNDEAPVRLLEEVQGILSDPERLAAMRRAMTALARPNAARDLARLVIEASAAVGSRQSAVGGAS
jgi:UDP-N-acetylglucosamine--N-acetylmuramyl-(pentapeptide) pyrophosphoryl-undecaprenol N-acetylglucosamine transferase